MIARVGSMQNTKVWIVDDDPEFLSELREALMLSGFEAEAFPNAAALRRRLAAAAPDIVLLDLKMDHESGFQLAYALKRHPRAEGVPVIAMTGHYTNREYAHLIQQCGIRLCLVKPINLANLLARIAFFTAPARRAGGGGARPVAPGRKRGRAGAQEKYVKAHTGGLPS